jgi:hypothetical protein
MRRRSRHERRSRSAGESARHTCMYVSSGESDGSAVGLCRFGRLVAFDMGMDIVAGYLRPSHDSERASVSRALGLAAEKVGGPPWCYH